MKQKITQKWAEKAQRSLFFFVALFFHVVIFFMVFTLVIFKAPLPVAEDFTKSFVPASAPPPPPPQTSQPTVTVSPSVLPTSAPTIVSPNSVASFTVPVPQIVNNLAQTPTAAKVVLSSLHSLDARLPAIMSTVQTWRTRNNILETDNDANRIVAKFPVFLAKYANGDYACNNYINDGNVTSGSLPNLIAKMAEWSRGNLVGLPPKIIAVDSPELLSSPPPFIFFTGHTDFKLTDAEVENLRKYLQVGGAIWGDSAFAGNGSRFDLAFHREMKRVIPDADKNFETVPLTHEIFTTGVFPAAKLPTGMNYREDPIEAINIDGKLAVLYTPNDYGDMMTMLLMPGRDETTAEWNITHDRYSPQQPLYTPPDFAVYHQLYFRNYDAPSCMAVFKLSMDIVTHLLMRFDKELQLTP